MGQDSKKGKTNKHDYAESEPRQPLGTYLQKERLKKQLTLEEIAEETCIHIATLRAIEENDKVKMPAEVFTRGFIKLYADFLGIDKKDIIERYDAESLYLHDAQDPNQEFFSNLNFVHAQSLFNARNFFILAGIVFLLLTVYFLFFSSTSQTVSESTHSTPKVENGQRQENTNNSIETSSLIANPFSSDTESLTAPPSIDKVTNNEVLEEAAITVHVHFIERTWIQVVIDDNAANDYLFDPDEVKIWQASDKVKLTIGNSAGVRLTVNEEEFPVNGAPGSSIVLTFPDDLPQT